MRPQTVVAAVFRDYLIKHRDEIESKRELAEKFADDREAYTNKGEYIQTITERALRNAGAT